MYSSSFVVKTCFLLLCLACLTQAAEEGRKKRIDFIKYESNYGLSLHDFSVLQILVLGSGAQHDQLTVENGNITIERAYLDLLLPDDRSSLPPGQYIIIDNQGPNAITGYFINTPEGEPLTRLGINGYITYKGGDGNDVALVIESDDSDDDEDDKIIGGVIGGFFGLLLLLILIAIVIVVIVVVLKKSDVSLWHDHAKKTEDDIHPL